MYCSRCGRKIVDSARFCPFCGTPLIRNEQIDENGGADDHEQESQTKIETKVKDIAERNIAVKNNLNDVILYCQYIGTKSTGDDNNKTTSYVFRNTNGRKYYIPDFLTKNLTLEKKGTWHWLEIKKIKSGKNRYNFPPKNPAFLKREIEIFTTNYSEGDIVTCPVIEKTNSLIKVALGPTFNAYIRREDWTSDYDFTSFRVNNIYRFRIDRIDEQKEEEKKRTNVKLEYVGRYDDSSNPQLLNLIPKSFGRGLHPNHEVIDLVLNNFHLSSVLSQKIGTELTTANIMKYIGEQYCAQISDHTIVVHQNWAGISIDVDLGIKNEHGVPIKAGINKKKDRKDDYYLALIGAVDPGPEMERFVFIDDWSKITGELADLALPEKWDYGDMANKEPRHILKQYLRYNFYKAKLDGGLYIEGDDAIFNTGLVDKQYDDIYCYLKKNDDVNDFDHKRWKICYFACRGKGQNGKDLNQRFPNFPTPPKYINEEKLENIFFDTTKELACDYEHIILDNLKRLPMSFITHTLAYDRELMHYSQNGASENKIQDYIKSHPDLIRSLESALKSAVITAIKYCQWNYKTAIPIYYARTNNISLLLPLKLTESNSNADVALVIERLANKNYQGQTILTLDMAYLDARQICRPNSDWLTLDNVEKSGEQRNESKFSR